MVQLLSSYLFTLRRLDLHRVETLRYRYETPPAEGFNALYSELSNSHQAHTVTYTVPPPFLGEGARGRGNVLRSA